MTICSIYTDTGEVWFQTNVFFWVSMHSSDVRGQVFLRVWENNVDIERSVVCVKEDVQPRWSCCQGSQMENGIHCSQVLCVQDSRNGGQSKKQCLSQRNYWCTCFFFCTFFYLRTWRQMTDRIVPSQYCFVTQWAVEMSMGSALKVTSAYFVSFEQRIERS